MASSDMTAKVKVVFDTDGLHDLEGYIGTLKIPPNDPFAAALRENVGSEIVAKVGTKAFLLRQWKLTDMGMNTYWDSIEYRDKKWRVPWRRRYRIALDKIWWRAVGWL